MAIQNGWLRILPTRKLGQDTFWPGSIQVSSVNASIDNEGNAEQINGNDQLYNESLRNQPTEDGRSEKKPLNSRYLRAVRTHRPPIGISETIMKHWTDPFFEFRFICPTPNISS